MTQMARTTPDSDDDSSTLSFSFNPPRSHTPNRPAAVPSASTFDFPPPSDTRFTFNTPPTPPTAASFGFSPPNTSGFTFAFTPSSSGDSHSITTPVTQDPATPTRSSRRILTPPSRATTTSTTRALFSALDLGPNSPETPGKLAPTDHGQFRRSNLSPNANVSTYRDLYNATPSPQPGPSSHPNQTNGPSIDSPSPSSFLTSGVRNLIIQSIETSSTDGEGDDEADIGSDLDSDYGSDNESSTYNVRDEELPDAPIYNAQLQNSLRDVQNHLSGLVRSMQASRMVHDGTTHVSDLYRQAETESKFEYPQTRIVGFIGDSGVGKSSLINSLLDCGGLARSSGSGEACTSVVTEFRQVDETHPHPYTIEADFMTIDEMIELIRELLMAYRIRHTRAFNEDLAEGESDRITRLSERSWATLQSLFPNEGELTEAFLSNEERGAEDRILARLAEWAMAGLNNRPGGPDALHYAIRARDIHDCRENIDILTVASREQERPALWPFVKLIRVYLRSGILRTGLVVADMPGFRDMNYARVRATEKYLRNICDEVFIVSEINRCRSDPSIEEIWHKCIGNQPMRIVCTKSETELDGEEIIRDPKMPARVIAETRRLLDRTEQVRRSLRRLGRRRRDSSGAQQAQYALREAEQNDELGRLELERKTLLINTRNEISRTHLSSEYQTNVEVFCVSRELYENYRGGERGQAADYIRLSGIPELRQYCQLVPADAQFRETDTFLRIRVPALLGSLNQWVLAGENDVTADRAETLRQVLDEAQRTLHSRLISRRSCIRSIKTELETMFKRSTVRYIRDLQVQERWKDGAIRASRDWDSMHHPSYSAFCRKYGVHQIGKESVRYWNNEILQDASEELDQCWSTLMEWLNRRQNTTGDEIYAIFNSVSTSIEAYTHLSPASIENLLDNLDTQRRGIAYTTQRTLEHLLLQTRRITRDVLDGHSSSSYIAEIMRPAYHHCNMESGTGSDRRRKDHMKEYVRRQEIFLKLPARFKMDYDVIINTAFADLERKLNEEVRNITRDLGGVIAVEGEVPEARRELGLAQRVRDVVSRLQAQVNEAHLILNRLRGRTTRSA